MHHKGRTISFIIVMAALAFLFFHSIFRELSDLRDTYIGGFAGKETLRIWYTDEALSDYMSNAAVAYGEKNNLRVIPTLVSESEYLEAINHASVQTDSVPDLYILSNDSLEKAYLAGLATEIIDEGNAVSEANFPRTALDAITYQDKLIAYPLYYETSALLYNETYLREWAKQQVLGGNEGGDEFTEEEYEALEQGGEDGEDTTTLSEEEIAARTEEYLLSNLPATIDDILAVANSFNPPEGVDVIFSWDVSDIFYNYYVVGEYLEVGGEHGDDASRFNIYNEETVACLEAYKALNQFFSIESDTVDYDTVIEDFLSGKIVFTIATTDVLEKIKVAQEEGTFTYDYGLALMPDVSEELDGRSLSVTGTVVVNGYSKNKAYANDLARFITTDYAENFYERTGKASPNIHVEQDNPGLQIFLMEYAESASLPKMIQTSNLWLQLEVLFSKVWNGGDSDELLQNLAIQISSQLQ